MLAIMSRVGLLLGDVAIGVGVANTLYGEEKVK